MNYIKHINMFFEMATGEGLSLKALGLYMVLLDKWNKLKFIETFKMTNSIIMSITNCSLHELRTARKELEEKKYIIYEKGKIGQAGTYKIINLKLFFCYINKLLLIYPYLITPNSIIVF